MSPGKLEEERYVVKEVRGMCLGAGGFVVVDRVDADHGELDIETWAPV